MASRGTLFLRRDGAMPRDARIRDASSDALTQRDWLLQHGVRRLGSLKSGFRFVDAHGRKPNRETQSRIASLVLPPAWTDVAIAPTGNAKLQAVGKDAAGRWQYRYHAHHVREREKKKYDRLMRFAQALPRMRRTTDTHLRAQSFGRERVLACILRILSTCFIRPGSQVYADENGSYGIATLRKRHVRVRGDTVFFEFEGKSKQHQSRQLVDRRVATIVRALLRAPRAEVFQYQNAEGRWVDVRRRDINRYIKEVMGEEFSAKDFRTWAGTLICACALARAGVRPSDDMRTKKRAMVAAVRETATHLGNTPAVCRSSYIFPSILSRYEKGAVIEHHFHAVEELTGPRLHRSERALLKLLVPAN